MTRPGPLRFRDALVWGLVVFAIIALAEFSGWALGVIGGNR